MDFPTKKYQIIYADPPWSYYNGKTTKKTNKDFGKFFARPESHYDTMSLDDMKQLPIQSISDDNCLLFMWVTGAKLDWGMELLKSWGFQYITVPFVWVKTQKDGQVRKNGTGWYTIQNAEYVLLGRKGKLERKRKDIKQIIMEQNGEHSVKPEEVRKRIELLYGEVPRIELFARRKVEGWEVWGNEVSENV